MPNDSNNVIMHRHPPTEGQYAAYNSAADNGIRAQAPWRAAGPAAVYRIPPRPRHTHTRTHTVFSLWFCSVSRLYRQGPCSCAKAPLSPASSPTLLLFVCGDFGSWLRGPCARDKTHFTALDGVCSPRPPNTGPHAHAFRFTCAPTQHEAVVPRVESLVQKTTVAGQKGEQRDTQQQHDVEK